MRGKGGAPDVGRGASGMIPGAKCMVNGSRGSAVSFTMVALFGISVATLLLGFLAYRAATFRVEHDETRRL